MLARKWLNANVQIFHLTLKHGPSGFELNPLCFQLLISEGPVRVKNLPRVYMTYEGSACQSQVLIAYFVSLFSLIFHIPLFLIYNDGYFFTLKLH